MRSGDADVALTFSYDRAEDLGADITVTTVGADTTRLVLPREHALADGPTDLGQLSDTVWIAGCPRCRSHLLDSTAGAGFSPDIRHTTDDYVLVQALVAQGLGVALLPETALRAFRHPDVATPPAPGTRARQHHVAHRTGAHDIPAVAAVIAAIGATAR